MMNLLTLLFVVSVALTTGVKGFQKILFAILSISLGMYLMSTDPVPTQPAHPMKPDSEVSQ